MRYLLSGLGILAALLLIFASGAMNLEYMRSLGKTPDEGRILALVSIGVDAMKCLLPVYIGWAWAAGRRVFALIASGAFVIFFVFALLSALGFASLNRSSVTGGREVVAARYEAAARDLAEAGTRKSSLATHRPQGVVAEALRGLEQDKRWSTSKSCGEATAPASRDFCTGYFQLKAELAVALEAERLDQRIATLKAERLAMEGAGAGLEADPQAGFLARLTGFDMTSIRMGLVGFIAVLVEIGAAFGLYLATAFGVVAPQRTPAQSRSGAGHPRGGERAPVRRRMPSQAKPKKAGAETARIEMGGEGSEFRRESGARIEKTAMETTGIERTGIENTRMEHTGLDRARAETPEPILLARPARVVMVRPDVVEAETEVLALPPPRRVVLASY